MELRAFFTVERTCLPFWEFYLFSLVTLDRQFRTFGDLFAFYGYPGSAVPSFWGFICSIWLPWISGLLIFGDSFTRFGYPGSPLSSFSGGFRSLWLPLNNIFILSGTLHSLWLPWISGK